MAALHSYELKGQKLSFANWISNLSPTETPFSSMTSKEATDQTVFYWQTDRLAPAKDNAVVEGADIVADNVALDMGETTVEHNYVQILRKSFKVSDTAEVLANYGRGREVAYQMEKFSTALKRDLETILLSDQDKDSGATDSVRKTAGFQKLVAAVDATDVDTGAKVHFKSGAAGAFTIANLQEMSYNLYLANSEASVIMFHPKHAAFFATLQSSDENVKMFEGDKTEFSHYVNTYIDAFGRSYKLVPNRFMPEDAVYFFAPSDFTQMVLRAPTKTELAKKGNYQHWMIEMEVGLRLRDKFAAGVLKLEA